MSKFFYYTSFYCPTPPPILNSPHLMFCLYYDDITTIFINPSPQVYIFLIYCVLIPFNFNFISDDKNQINGQQRKNTIFHICTKVYDVHDNNERTDEISTFLSDFPLSLFLPPPSHTNRLQPLLSSIKKVIFNEYYRITFCVNKLTQNEKTLKCKLR